MKTAGYDSLHVRDIRMSTASDREIFKRAKDDGRVVITADTDLGALFLCLRLSHRRLLFLEILFKEVIKSDLARLAKTFFSSKAH